MYVQHPSNEIPMADSTIIRRIDTTMTMIMRTPNRGRGVTVTMGLSDCVPELRF